MLLRFLYISLIDHNDYDDVLAIIKFTLQDVISAFEVPACNEIQCGRAANNSLKDAQKITEDMLDKYSDWKSIY